MRISEKTLSQLPASVSKPGYDRSKVVGFATTGGGAWSEEALLMDQGEQAGFDGANPRERCLAFRLKPLPG